MTDFITIVVKWREGGMLEQPIVLEPGQTIDDAIEVFTRWHGIELDELEFAWSYFNKFPVTNKDDNARTLSSLRGNLLDCMNAEGDPMGDYHGRNE